MGTPGNVIAGPARLFVCTAPYKESGVDKPWGAGGSASFHLQGSGANVYSDFGYLEEGVEVTYTPTLVDIQTDHEVMAIQRLLTAEECVVKAVMQEATLLNLQLALAGDSGSAVGGDLTAEDNTGPDTFPGFSKLKVAGMKSAFDIGPPVLGSVIREVAVAVLHRNPAYVGDTDENLGARVLYLYRATVSADLTSKWFKGGTAMVPVEFKALQINSPSFASVELYDVTTDEAWAGANDPPSPLV